MISLILKRWKHRRWSTLLILIAFTAFFFLIPFNLQQIQQTGLSIEQNLEEQGRGQFDILVRPAGSRSEVENSQHIVTENYIGDSSGGISLAEWEEIKKNPLIEVAAPVASIGYFSGKMKTIGLPIPEKPTLFSWNYLTTDGIHTYPVSEEEHLMFLQSREGTYVDYLRENTSKRGGSDVYMDIDLPQNHYLLVGIDPESEEQLIGQPFPELFDSPISEDAVMNQQSTGAEVVKILQRTGLTVPLSLELKMKEIDADYHAVMKEAGLSSNPEENHIFELYNFPDVKDALLNRWIQDESFQPETYTIDLSQELTPFEGNAYYLDDKMNLRISEKFGAIQDTGIYYTAEKVQYIEDGDQIFVKQVDNLQPPVYKKVQQHGESLFGETGKMPYLIEQVGTFDVEEPAGENLVSSPLGIYSIQKTISESGKEVMPTISPGSFISAPASAVTDLNSATLIKGDQPIDAVRIKVAGIHSYNEKAEKEIEKVATDLLQKGYEVDIVTGSSFKEAVLEVEGIGQVTESWTTLGVAQSLKSSWDMTAILLAIVFVIFCFAWISTRTIFETYTYQEERELLQKVGWTKSQIRNVQFWDQAGVILLSCIIAIALLAMAETEWIYLAYTFGIGVAALLNCWTVISLPRQKQQNRVWGAKLQSLQYYRHLLGPMTSLLSLALVVLVLQLLILATGYFSADETTMGRYIFQQTGASQIGIMLITGALTFYSLGEGLNVLFKERQGEIVMYRAIGWTRKQINRVYFRDLFFAFSVSSLIGLGTSFLFVTLLSYSYIWMAIAFVITAFLIFFILLFNSLRVIGKPSGF